MRKQEGSIDNEEQRRGGGIVYGLNTGERATRKREKRMEGRKAELSQEGVNKEINVCLGELCVRYLTGHRKCVDETLGNRLNTSSGLGDNP